MQTSAHLEIKTALLSVSDKTGLIAFATGLIARGVKLVSTGGTAKSIREAGLAVTDVSDITGFPEMMDGRVKTLHPKVHGGLLAVRGNADHRQAQEKHAIANIDLVAINLYPFEETVAKGASAADTIENIDIGGPAMIRSAAKNHESVTVIVDPADYQTVLDEMSTHANATTLKTRQHLAGKAYGRTAAYDAAIASWFNTQNDVTAPAFFAIGGKRAQSLRYGENPHQTASAYKTGDAAGILDAKQMQGKELSYNNINDADAALDCISEFPSQVAPACVIVKHANPCGVATGRSLAEAYRKALSCDATSAFGGIIAVNRAITAETAIEITKIFTEVILAPGIDEDALAILGTKKNLRLLLLSRLPDPRRASLSVKSITGGLLVQSRDNAMIEAADARVVTQRQPSEAERHDLQFSARVAKHVKSNAIVFARDGMTTGIGAGQMSRIDSTRIAVRKSEDASKAMGQAEPLVKGSVMASDAFFPFADGIEAAAAAGATAIIQPGGSLKDDEVIAAANRLGLAMLFTGLRHFRH